MRSPFPSGDSKKQVAPVVLLWPIIWTDAMPFSRRSLPAERQRYAQTTSSSGLPSAALPCTLPIREPTLQLPLKSGVSHWR